MINFCYDVPVKLYSAHLCAMATALVLVDGRVLKMLLLNRAVPPAEYPPLFAARWMNRTAKSLALALVTWSQRRRLGGPPGGEPAIAPTRPAPQNNPRGSDECVWLGRAR